MGVTPEGGVPLARSHASPPSGRGSALRDAATAAWLAVLPCAALTILAVLYVGPWLGDRLTPSQPTFDFLGIELTPASRQTGRFLVSLSGPILLSLAIVATVRRQPVLPRALTTGGVVATQALLIAAVAACFVGQRQPAYGINYFSPRTLVVSALIAVFLLAASRSERLRHLVRARAEEARWQRLTAGGIALALTAIWMLHAVNTDRSIAWSVDVTQYHLAFHMDETFALLNGLTPLSTFTPQYGALWPYVVAPVLLVLGKTLLAFTAAMSAVTGVALLAIYGVLRRVTRNALAALLLFVPFLATTLFVIGGTDDVRHTLGSYFAVFPLRAAGPLLLAWLTARHLSASEPRRSWPLFAGAGLVVINNVDFGVAAFGAALAAVLWTAWPRTRAAAVSLLADVAAGVGAAVALVSLVTLVRSGSLPQPGRLTEFARIFGLNGFATAPIPGIRGLPTIIYLTFAGAIATATVLAVRGARDRVLTGMLAWTGVYGLGSAMYYMSRAVLPTTFSAWALAIALLAIVALRSLAVHPLRRQAAMALVVLFGLGIVTCSIAQFTPPWVQLDRLREDPLGQESEVELLAPPSEPETRRFVSSLADGPRRFVVRKGAPVVLLATTGHRIADAYGIRNVTPYTGFDSILTAEQAHDTLDALRDAGGNTVLMPRTDRAELNRILMQRGFQVVTEHGLHAWPRRDGAQDLDAMFRIRVLTVGGFVKWVDTRHLHAEALR